MGKVIELKEESCCEMNEKSKNIVNALKNVNSGKEVLIALLHVPTENLAEIVKMIVEILAARAEPVEGDEE